MNSYGIRPSIRIGIVLLGSVVELRPKSSKKKEISGFLNERSLVHHCGGILPGALRPLSKETAGNGCI
jgi:hypothetical protein